jgi:photosystem II stability/assembly factor-like uncharacterized protein
MRPRVVLPGLVALVLLGGCRDGGGSVRTMRSPEREGGRPGAYEALAWWGAGRAYPGADLPPEGYARAVDRRRAMDAAARRPGGPAWEPLGPLNIAGRVLALALNPLHPTTVWAGSASGGLWRSTSGGLGARAWTRVPTGHGALAVSSVTFHPADTLTMVVGTGEVYRYQEGGNPVYRPTRGSYGVGILKTTDGGATWTKALDWSRHQERGVWAVRFDPTNPSTLWAATTEGVYVSRDAGATWTPSLAVIMATDLSINPSNPLEVVAACGNQQSTGFGIYRTTNGGATWTRIGSGLPMAWIGKAQLDRHPTEHATVYVSIGNGIDGVGTTGLFRSTNGGATWGLVTNTNYASFQGWFSHYVGINPHRPSDVLLGGLDFWRSTTGGASPVQESHDMGRLYDPPIGGPDNLDPNYMPSDHHAVAFHPTDPDVVYFAHDGGVSRSDDGGQTFLSVNGGLQTTQFYYGISAAPGDSMLLFGGMQDNGTAVYSGTGRWQRPYGGDGSWTALDPQNPAVRYLSYQYLSLLRSDDGGATWSWKAPPTGGDNTGFIAPYALAPSQPSRLYAASSRVYRSNDRGDTWGVTYGGVTLDPSGNAALTLAVAPSNPDVVWVSTVPNLTANGPDPGPPRLYATRNGGQAWADVTAGLPDRFFTDVALHPTDDRVAYVAASGWGTSHLFKTTEGGQTWADVGAGLPDAPTNAVALDPLAPAHVYVGNDVGVFASRDGGATWASVSEGLPEAVIVMDLVVSPADRTLRAATHGNGAYRLRLEPSPVAAEGPPLPAALALDVAGPNPFRDATALRFSLVAPADVRLAVYDLAGRRVATLAGGRRAAGVHRVALDGRALAPATYVVRLEAGGRSVSRRLTRAR